MGRLTVEELCRRHAHIGVDSNLLIYLIDQVSPWDDLVDELITAIEGGLCRATLSALALGEILGALAHSGELALLERYADEIRDIPGLTIGTLGPELAIDAAVIGGMRHPIGPFIGAILYVLLKTFAIDIVNAERFNTLIGLIFLTIVFVSPDGILGLWQRVKPHLVPESVRSAQ